MVTLPPELYIGFRDEAHEILARVSAALDGLLAGPDEDSMAELRKAIARDLHNIKGAASSLMLAAVAEVCHASEELLGLMDNPSASVQEIATRLTLSAAWLHTAVGERESDASGILNMLDPSAISIDGEESDKAEPPADNPQNAKKSKSKKSKAAKRKEKELPPKESAPIDKDATPSPAAPQPSTRASSDSGDDEQIRIPISSLEKLLSPLASVVNARTQVRFQAAAVQDVGDTLYELARELSSDLFGPEALEITQKVRDLADDLRKRSRYIEDNSRRIGQSVGDIEESIRRMRLVSAEVFASEFQLSVKDAAIRTGKDINFVVESGGVGIDRRLLQGLKAPVMHLLRNAVDHGLESADERKAAGKPSQGLLCLGFASRGETIELYVRDDGGGINIDRVKQKAIANGLVDEHTADTMSDHEIRQLITHPGFSTASTVTELSGRGVGMDVVAGFARGQGGSLEIESTEGEGTRFVLSLPASLLTTRVLMVRAGAQTYAVPMSNITTTGRASVSDHYKLDGKIFSDIGDKPAVVQYLDTKTSKADENTKLPTLILETGSGHVALVVDEIVGEDEIVVRPLGPPARSVPGVLGTAIAESGNVILVLQPRSITQLGHFDANWARSARTQQLRRARILVVDDSITTRTLERHILESNGYLVRSASDGMEALEMLRTEPADLVVSDVEMPRLDGIGLVRAIRSEEALCEIPLILVTSLASDSDKRRGAAAGAQAYIVKGQFDQGVLLETVKRLLNEG